MKAKYNYLPSQNDFGRGFCRSGNSLNDSGRAKNYSGSSFYLSGKAKNYSGSSFYHSGKANSFAGKLNKYIINYNLNIYKQNNKKIV